MTEPHAARTPPQEIAPGLVVQGFTPPLHLSDFKLLAFGMDSAMLYPGAEELVEACKAAGMALELAIGEQTDANEKLELLQAACLACGLTPAQSIVVGKTDSDLPMMGVAGLSIAYCASAVVAQQAMVAIHSGSMDRVLQVVTLHVANTPPGLDLSVLDVLVGHNPVKFRKFALLFISSVDTVLAQVDTGIAERDLPLLMAMGHRAKSTALNIGAFEFAGQCLLLEKTARAQECDASLALAKGLRSLFDQVQAAIEQRLANSPVS